MTQMEIWKMFFAMTSRCIAPSPIAVTLFCAIEGRRLSASRRLSSKLLRLGLILRTLLLLHFRDSNFLHDSSRIQEGMVFVSMTSDELLARTAQYQIQYSGPRRRCRNRRGGLQPSQEYLTGLRSRSPPQSAERTVLMGPDSHSAADQDAAGQGAHDPQAEFRVTTEYDETPEENIFLEGADDGLPSTEPERTQEEDPLCSDSEEDSASDDDDGEDGNVNPFARRLELQRRGERIRRFGQTRGPSLVDPLPASGTTGNTSGTTSGTTGTSGNASDTEVLKPHARFFIEREKSMVSIKFHPPPYVLFLSLPQPCHTDCF